MKNLFFISILFFVLLATSCSENKLHGKWENTTTALGMPLTTTLSFDKDGSGEITINSDKFQEVDSFKYVYSPIEELITITGRNNYSFDLHKVKIDGNKMNASMEGEEMVFDKK